MSKKRSSPAHDGPSTAYTMTAAGTAAGPSTKRTDAAVVNLSSRMRMPNAWTSLIDNVWAEGDFQGGLSTLEQFVGASYHPHPAHLQQILALALSPISCISPPSHSNSMHVHYGNSTPSAPPVFPLPSLDPTKPGTSARIRREALALLANIGRTNGARSFANALPGFAEESGLYGAEDVLLWHTLSGEELAPDEQDTQIAIAGKRIAKCSCLWECLSGNASREKVVLGELSVVMDESWEVLQMLLRVWSEEAIDRGTKGLSIISPSFLRQFARPEYGSRKVSEKVIDLIFWSFEQRSSLDEDEEEAAAEAELTVAQKVKVSKESKGRGNGRKAESLTRGDERLENVEMETLSIGEKRRLSATLIELIAQLASTSPGFLDMEDVIGKVVRRLRSLDPSAFQSIIEYFPTSVPGFILRLCTLYLESYSHPLPEYSSSTAAAAQSHTSPIKSSHSFSSTLPTASPSRATRALGITASSTSLVSDVDTVRSCIPNERILLALLARIPSEVPLDLPPVSADSVEEDGDERSATRRASQHRPSFRPFVDAHRSLKLLLLNSILEAGAVEASLAASRNGANVKGCKSLGGGRSEIESRLIGRGTAKAAMESVQEVVDVALAAWGDDDDDDGDDQVKEESDGYVEGSIDGQETMSTPT